MYMKKLLGFGIYAVLILAVLFGVCACSPSHIEEASSETFESTGSDLLLLSSEAVSSTIVSTEQSEQSSVVSTPPSSTAIQSSSVQTASAQTSTVPASSQSGTAASKNTVSSNSSSATTRSYFSGNTGNAQENLSALEAALKLIDTKGWASQKDDEFRLAQTVATYIASSISYSSGDRSWTAYAGLVNHSGTCWAYAQAYLFVAKELGLTVEIVSVRNGTMSSGMFDVYDYHTNQPLGAIGFASDHMGIQYIFKGTKIYIETQLGQMYIFKDNTYYLLTKVP